MREPLVRVALAPWPGPWLDFGRGGRLDWKNHYDTPQPRAGWNTVPGRRIRPMRQERNAFRLGLTMIVALVLFCAAVLFIGGKSFEPRDSITVRIGHDQNVPRIKAGAPIICGPQQVGSVTSVGLVEAPALDQSGAGDFLYFEMRGEVNRSLGLREDCAIIVEGPLLGDNGQLRIVNRGSSATPLDPDAPVYARASGFATDWEMISTEFDEQNPNSLLARIKGQLNPDMPQSLVGKIHASVDDVNAMTVSLRNSMDPTRKTALIYKVDSILTHVNGITAALKVQLQPGTEQTVMAKIHRSLDHVDQALGELLAAVEENRDGVRQTIARAENVMITLDQSIIPTIEAELDRTRTESLLAQVHQAFDEINTTLEDVSVVSAKARRVAILAEHRVVTIIESATEASQHLKAVAKDIRRSPWRLIHKPGEAESKQAYLLDAAREFAVASGHLDRSAADLAALFEANDGRIPSDDPTLMAIRRKIQETLEEFTAAEDALWNQLDLK